jgi:HAE1 family hydrophobic/amphiphilic exporter-1
MISKFFIERPVLSNVIAILMLIGAVALFNLAIAQYRPRCRSPPAIPVPAPKP